MILAQDLRDAVLQAALQGKLTKQLDTDSSVDILLHDIKLEKKKLIDKGEIKREKVSSSIDKEDIPFRIPSTWEWVRMQDILDVRDGTHDSPTYQISGVPFITSKNLIDGKIDFDNIKYISQEDADFFNKRSKVNKGDILMAMIGSIGKPVLVDSDKAFAIKNVALLKKVPNTNLNMKYVLLLLYYSEAIMKNQSLGGVQKFVSLTYLRKYVIPLPPIEEQQRIVDRVDELMEKIDEYEKVEKELIALEKKFPNDMKNALLQAAMQGKLMEQLDSDSSVDEMLEAIKENDLIGKTRRPKKEIIIKDVLDEIDDSNIPSTWKWVKLGDVSISNIGLTYKPTNISSTGTIVLRSSNILNGKMDYKDVIRVDMDIPDSKMCDIGDILICVRNGSKQLVGKAAIIDKNGMAFGAFMAILKSRCNPYIFYFLNSHVFKKQMHKKSGTETINQITQDMLFNCVIPLPPIEEQQRIVEKLEQLLPLCETL